MSDNQSYIFVPEVQEILHLLLENMLNQTEPKSSSEIDNDLIADSQIPNDDESISIFKTRTNFARIIAWQTKLIVTQDSDFSVEAGNPLLIEKVTWVLTDKAREIFNLPALEQQTRVTECYSNGIQNYVEKQNQRRNRSLQYLSRGDFVFPVLSVLDELNPMTNDEIYDVVAQQMQVPSDQLGLNEDGVHSINFEMGFALSMLANSGAAIRPKRANYILSQFGRQLLELDESEVAYIVDSALKLRDKYKISVAKTTPSTVSAVGVSGNKEVSELEMPFVKLGEELLFDPDNFFVEVNDLLDDRPQAIFYGPPGTGKTWAALKLAQVIAGDESRTKLVQFHPSYAYEDFIEGWRPTQEGNFEITDGPLKRMAADARDNSTQKFVLVIDEINRANLSKVLGELFFLLEYRDRAITLQYSDEQFKLPKNLIIIGTMNTADRSIALVDAALRRRFHFHGFFPDREPIQGLLQRWLNDTGQSSMVWVADLVDKANSKLNERDLAIGPSHFMKYPLDEEKVHRIWKRSIMPYIEDYFFDDPDQATEFDYDHLRNDTQP